MTNAGIRSALLELYEQVARDFDFPVGVLVRELQRHVHTIELVHRFAPLRTHPRVLDLAAGWAIPSRCLLKEGYAIHLTDSPSIGGEKLCDYSAKTFPLTRIDDLEREELPFPPGSFDVVLWLATIEHLQNSPKPVFQSIHRVLRPGGVLIMDTPNILELRKRVMLLMGRSIMPNMKYIFNAPRHADHHYEYTKADLEYVVGQSGFAIAHSEVVDTISGITVRRRLKHKDRTEAGSQLRQATQFVPGFDPLNFYSYLKLPFSALVKLVPSLRDMLYIVGRKDDAPAR